MTEKEHGALMTVKELERHLRLGHTKIHELLRTGEIPSLKIGKSRRVRRTDLERFLEALVDGTNV